LADYIINQSINVFISDHSVMFTFDYAD